MELTYRPCVGIMLINEFRQVFVGQRIDSRISAWQMPQGGIDQGEDYEKAAFRELKEETSIVSAEIIAESKIWRSYDIPSNLIPKFWDGQYKGQTQKWFLMKFRGDDAEININTQEPEFREWKWLNLNKISDYVVPFKRKLYEEIVTEFSSMI